MSHTKTNSLINETSPYLLQHAHNPVDWMPWNEESLSLAKKENKLILISIGYAACHWCHVMEHESFEDTTVAKTMNSNFVNIKVDREERPDVDQVYMNAVQLMTGQGGWPLNVVALPDGRPVWGGTYFKKDHWINVLEQLANLYKDNPDKLIDYAEKLEQGIKNMDLVVLNSEEKEFNREFIHEVVDEWSNNFDRQKGGPTRAPKFMLPNNYQFLLRYAYQNNDEELMDYVNLTLTKMALGGIYDQIGGGFSRYSVDTKWHVPHFEKMLYDNAQLVSLYSEAFSLTKKSLYRDVVVETLSFIEKELTSSEGVFYSSLDADSFNKNEELEEGAFYVWTQKELKIILGDDFDLFKEYYNINDYGYWEKGNYVLIRKIDDHDFAAKNDLKESQLSKKKEEWKNALLLERDKRARPRLDDKTLTSWNALMIKAYVDAFKSLGDQHYVQVAIRAMKFILTRQLSSDGRLFRNYKNGKSTINAYLIDYATTIEALIALYQVTSEEKYINTARDLTNFTFDNFFDDNSNMFYFTSKSDPELVTRNIEFRDNVIPASNSIMAKNLFELSHYFGNSSYLETSSTMLNNIKPQMKEYGSGFSNWLDLKLNFTFPYYEVAIVGSDAHNFAKELNSHYLPNILTVISEKASEAPLLKDRLVENKTFIYVCVDNTCQLPVTEINEAFKLISFQ